MLSLDQKLTWIIMYSDEAKPSVGICPRTPMSVAVLAGVCRC